MPKHPGLYLARAVAEVHRDPSGADLRLLLERVVVDGWMDGGEGWVDGWGWGVVVEGWKGGG